MTGMKAILGIGKPTLTTGSKNQRTGPSRAIRMPRTMPGTAAMANPTSVRYSVEPERDGQIAAHRVVQMRSQTSDRGRQHEGA